MSLLKILIFSILLTIVVNPVYAQSDDLGNLVAEFEADNISSLELGVAELERLPGQRGYWWTNFKRNVDLWFTFDENDKTTKELDLANIKLAEAAELADKSSNDHNISKALDKYKKIIAQVTHKLKNNPNQANHLRAVLDRLDRDELKHQQVLRRIGDKVPEDVASRIEKIRQETARDWYEVNKSNLRARLEKAIDQNNTGSKFKQIRNMATLEELQESLPVDAREHIEGARAKAQSKLQKKLQNISDDEGVILSKYLDNIKLHEVNRQKLFDHLEDAQLPKQAQTRIIEVKHRNLERLKKHWQSLDKQRQEKFLEHFEGSGDPTKLEVLNTLRQIAPQELHDRFRQLDEGQREKIKTRIQTVHDVRSLEVLERRLDSAPSLLREIRDAKTELQQAPDPVRYIR